MSVVIRSEKLGKRFDVGRFEAYGTLRDSLARALAAPLDALRRRSRPASRQRANESIWAVKDASFEIRDGEIVGIIGRNGSGKSTLLKILSRITEPTAGRAEVRGRVGSLLEVGTGFHPELTGRENVFVNGAILGMSRREIVRKFDEIVAFSGVERFLDTPVKRYSSGMQMRLAFAVAAHLEPNILLVDEVLAVGDMEFQRRCLGKMKEVSLEGRTVVLVSHQMGQIRRLCGRTMWLDGGQVRCFGETGQTISEYESAMTGDADDATGTHCFLRWEIVGAGHTLKESANPFTIRVQVQIAQPVSQGHFGLGIMDEEDRVLAGWAFEPLSLSAGRHHLDVTISSLPLRPKNYRLSVALFDGGSNLTGGRLVEKWTAVPPLTVDVVPVGHPQDEWAGVLNVAATLRQAESAQEGHPLVAVESV
jgi:homopolymeric O-antigen transport system ATP-binding protein